MSSREITDEELWKLLVEASKIGAKAAIRGVNILQPDRQYVVEDALDPTEYIVTLSDLLAEPAAPERELEVLLGRFKHCSGDNGEEIRAAFANLRKENERLCRERGRFMAGWTEFDGSTYEIRKIEGVERDRQSE